MVVADTLSSQRRPFVRIDRPGLAIALIAIAGALTPSVSRLDHMQHKR